MFHNSILIPKRTTSDKLTQEGCRWNLFFRYRFKITQVFFQAMGSSILVAIFRHFVQDWFSMSFEHGQLEEQSGVEHHIGLLLEWCYPSILAALYAIESSDGLASGVAAVAVVAHDTADEAHVDGRYPVVVVEVDGSE